MLVATSGELHYITDFLHVLCYWYH